MVMSGFELEQASEVKLVGNAFQFKPSNQKREEHLFINEQIGLFTAEAKSEPKASAAASYKEEVEVNPSKLDIQLQSKLPSPRIVGETPSR